MGWFIFISGTRKGMEMSSTTSNSNSPLPTTDSTAQTAEQTVLDVLTIATKSAEAVAISAQPWLSDPFVRPVWEGSLEWFTGLIAGALGESAAFIVVDVQKFIALKNAASALVQLKSAQALGDQNAITKASSEVDAAVAPILHYFGSA